MACRPSDICRQIGGSACDYQAILVPSTTLADPGCDGQPAANLYIASLEVNVLNAAFRVVWGTLSLPGAVVLPWRAFAGALARTRW